MDSLVPVCCVLVILGVIAAVVVPKVMQKRASDEAKRMAEARRRDEEDRRNRYENSIPSAKFSVVHDPREMLEVILGNLKVKDLREDAPLLETIYFSSVSEESLVITAGNRTITHWNMTVRVQPDGRNGTSGTVTLDRSRNKVLKWKANIDDTFYKVRAVVDASDINGKYTGEEGLPLPE